MKTRYFLIVGILFAVPFTDAAEVISDLKVYCEANSKNLMVSKSIACKVANDDEHLDDLCQSLVKANVGNARKLRDVISHYAAAKGIDDDVAEAKLCKRTIDASIESDPKCKDGSVIERKWWDGKAWSTTSESFGAVQKKADGGDKVYQFNLANWLFQGSNCIAKDKRMGAQYLCRAYDQGVLLAKQQVGTVKDREALTKEYGCAPTEHQKQYAFETKKLEEIAKVNLKKAESGDVAAMTKVAVTYQSSDYGLPQDFGKAFYWATRAAQKGNVEAMGLLGSLYSRGDGVEKNNAEAFRWSLRAAEKGDLDSQYFVGICYLEGQGTQENLVKSVQWLVTAMDRGHEEAKEQLVQMYLNGQLQSAAFKSLSQRIKAIERKLNQ